MATVSVESDSEMGTARVPEEAAGLALPNADYGNQPGTRVAKRTLADRGALGDRAPRRMLVTNEAIIETGSEVPSLNESIRELRAWMMNRFQQSEEHLERVLRESERRIIAAREEAWVAAPHGLATA